MSRLLAVASVVWLGTATHAHAGIVYASNFNANTITSYDLSTGAFLGTVVAAGAELSGANGLRIGPDGALYVTGQFSNDLVKYSPATGALIGVLDPGNAAGLDSPQGMVFGPDGLLYVASSANDRIARFNPVTGNFVDTFATLDATGHNGPITPVFAGGYFYVSAFDSGSLLQLNAATGALLNTFPGPPGFGLADMVVGPDGNLYVEAINLTDFTGNILRYSATTGELLGTFVPTGSGGLVSPGGLAFAANGFYVANVLVDADFNDVGSTILRYNAANGAFESQLVGPGQGLDVPFSLAAQVPEPGTFVLLGAALASLGAYRFRVRPPGRVHRSFLSALGSPPHRP